MTDVAARDVYMSADGNYLFLTSWASDVARVNRVTRQTNWFATGKFLACSQDSSKVLIQDGANVKLNNITDGTSNTLAFAETVATGMDNEALVRLTHAGDGIYYIVLDFVADQYKLYSRSINQVNGSLKAVLGSRLSPLGANWGYQLNSISDHGWVMMSRFSAQGESDFVRARITDGTVRTITTASTRRGTPFNQHTGDGNLYVIRDESFGTNVFYNAADDAMNVDYSFEPVSISRNGRWFFGAKPLYMDGWSSPFEAYTNQLRLIRRDANLGEAIVDGTSNTIEFPFETSLSDDGSSLALSAYGRIAGSGYRSDWNVWVCGRPRGVTPLGREVLFKFNTSNRLGFWSFPNGGGTQWNPIWALKNSSWSLMPLGDLSSDGLTDIAWRNGETMGFWPMAGASARRWIDCATPPFGQVRAIGDINGDVKDDLIYIDSGGAVRVVYQYGWVPLNDRPVGNLAAGWSVLGSADYDTDGTMDILIGQASTRSLGYWRMSNGTVASFASIPLKPSASLEFIGLGDYNNDNVPDLYFRDPLIRRVVAWTMDGTTRTGAFFVGGTYSPDWTPVGVGRFFWN